MLSLLYVSYSWLVKMFLKLFVIGCLVAMETTYVMSFRPWSCRDFPGLCRMLSETGNSSPARGTKGENLQNSVVGRKRNYRWKQKFGARAEEPDLGKYHISLKHAQK
jgi:hypothetical protein